MEQELINEQGREEKSRIYQMSLQVVSTHNESFCMGLRAPLHPL